MQTDAIAGKVADDAFRIRRLGGFIGAEIRGLDLGADHAESVYDKVRVALSEHGMLVFSGQADLPLDQYVRLGERFGKLEHNVTIAHPDGFPQIGMLIKEAGHKTSIGDMWHVDHTYLAVPMRYTMLRAVELPAYGGDTLFLSVKAAFAALPEGMKQALRGLKALHSRTYLIKDAKYARQYFKERPAMDGGKSNNQMTVHPVVVTLPETGEEVLFVNPGYVVKLDGWTAKLSAGLLNTLFEHCQQPEFQMRLKWEPGMIVIWDNRQTWHFAVNDYAGQRRLMQRLVIA